MTAPTPTAATTPEELAAQTAASLFDGTIITESRLRDAIVAAIRKALEIDRDTRTQPGMALVPIEPTEAMLRAAIDRPQPDPFEKGHPWGSLYRAVYKAMVLTADPSAKPLETSR